MSSRAPRGAIRTAMLFLREKGLTPHEITVALAEDFGWSSARMAVERARRDGILERKVPTQAPTEKTVNQQWLANARANILHLADLKRAGHTRFQTEYHITPDTAVGPATLRARRLVENHSPCGSPAAMCAEARF